MRPRALPAAAALLLALVGPAGCGTGAWDYGVFDVAQEAAGDAPCPACDCAAPAAVDGGGADGGRTGTCHDCLASLVGVGMRFTVLTITEPFVPDAPNPAALPEFLNNMWTEDVRRYVLNIILRVDEVDTAAGRLSVTAGAGWHDVPLADLPQKPGDPLTQVPTTYYLMPGSVGTFRVALDADCDFEPLGETALGFHPGPEDSPTMCSPDFENSIPIQRLLPSGRIAADCRRIVSGHLSGCIPKATADRICSWGPSPDLTGWFFEPNPAYEPVDGVSYCKRWCGTTPGATTTQWTNFGGFVTIIRVPLTCDTDGDGELDGYSIAGDFEAEVVPIAAAAAE